MKDDRSEMKRALNAIAVPEIRALGFVGSFPHFRRKRGTELQLVMFQFNRHGGSFCLEAGRISHEQVLALQDTWQTLGKSLTESTLTVGHCHWNCRVRLGGKTVGPGIDHWFEFGLANPFEDRGNITEASRFNRAATDAAQSVRTQLAPFFGGAP